VDLVEDCNENVKTRGIYETPGGTLITTAHRELESLVLDRQTRHQKEILAINYAQLVYDGHWFTPLRQALDAFFAKINEVVQGSVTLSLYKGNNVVRSRKSPNSLYRGTSPIFAAQAHP
jgi:argininosuccinate synthase